MNRKPSSTGISLVQQPLDFFRELITEALERNRMHPSAETEFYLVNLLNQFILADRLYLRDSEGHFKEEPLALMIKEALDEKEAQAQRSLFQHVGDVSLYTAGFFQESLDRKHVDVGYYVQLGGHAYRQAATLHTQSPKRAVFSELADHFSRLVDVLADVSDKTTQKSEVNLLRLYENWIRTKSTRAEKALKEAGINPIDIHTKSSSGSQSGSSGDSLQ